MSAMRRRFRLRPAAVTTFLVILAFVPATRAYERVVHLDATTRVVEMWGIDLTRRERHWVGFCAELPDEVDELSAISLYKGVMRSPYRWVSWGWGDSTADRRTQMMVKVQRLLHGLTGGSIDNLAGARDVSLGQLVSEVAGAPQGQKRLEALCALGFGIHLLGDSYAHRNLSDPTRMYATGQGHARHGTRPDRILRLGRRSDAMLLAAFSENVAVTGSTRFEPPWKRVPWLRRNKTIEDLERATAEGDPNETATKLAEHDAWADLDGNHLSPSEHDVEACQDYLDDLFANQAARDALLPRVDPGDRLAGAAAPRCHCIWRRYARITAQSFFERRVGDPDFGALADYADPFSEDLACD
jgi:hypothetical protein